MTTAYPDSAAAVRTWLRAELTAAGGRVFHTFPESDSPEWPLVTLTTIAEPGDRLGTEPLVQFDVYSDNRAEALAAANDLRSLLEDLNEAHATAGGVKLQGSYGVSVRPFYQANDPLRRYAVEANLVVRALST